VATVDQAAHLRGPGSPFSRSAPRLLEVHLAELAVASGRPVPAFAAVARVPVLGTGVAQTVTVHVAEVPRLAGQDGLMTASAVVEAGLDRGS
jgi:hypothetical protein